MTAVQRIGLFTASIEALLGAIAVPVMALADVQLQGSGCGKEFSWTKPRAYVGKVSDREGGAVEHGRHQERAERGERERVRRKRERQRCTSI